MYSQNLRSYKFTAVPAVQKSVTRNGLKQIIAGRDIQEVIERIKFSPAGDRIAGKGLIVQVQPLGGKKLKDYHFVLLNR